MFNVGCQKIWNDMCVKVSMNWENSGKMFGYPENSLTCNEGMTATKDLKIFYTSSTSEHSCSTLIFYL